MPNLINVHIREHLHPLGGRIIFWNFVLLLLIKLILPQSAFHTASLLNLAPTFDSREIISVTNTFRIANNLSELVPNTKLDLAASQKLTDMANQEYFAHTSPTGIDPWHWIKNSEYSYSVAGENLAIGFVTADDTVNAWLNSPSHKANLLNSKYRDIGVAVANVEISGRRGILVVQMFGLSSGKTIVATLPTTPLPSQTATTQVAVTNTTPQTQGESIAIAQEISTDPVISPVEEPVVVNYQDAEKITKVSVVLNNIFSAYALLLTVTSAVALLMFRKDRQMVYKMALNFGIFILAITIPASKLILEGLIF